MTAADDPTAARTSELLRLAADVVERSDPKSHAGAEMRARAHRLERERAGHTCNGRRCWTCRVLFNIRENHSA